MLPNGQPAYTGKRTCLGRHMALVEVLEKRDVKRDDRGLLVLAFTLLNQRGEVTQGGTARLLMRRANVETVRWGMTAA